MFQILIAMAALVSPPTASYLHIWGLPWELSNSEVATALTPLLPDGVEMLEPPLLPLDRKARRTGRALLRLRCEDAAACVTALHGQSVGSRWLEARLSNDDEFSAQRRILEEAEAKANDRAPQSFSQPTEEHASIADLPDDPRDIVLLCHEVRESVSNGEYELNNLREGRVDVLARCVSATLFVSHGVRRSSRVWIVLRDAGLTICCDGGTARSLSPDERSLAAAMKRAIGGSPDSGWSVHRDETLEERLRSLTGSKQLVVLHELGEPLEAVLQSNGGGGDGTVLVVGDHVGYSREEELLLEELGGKQARVSKVPLLASHCIVLAHAALDGLSETRASDPP